MNTATGHMGNAAPLDRLMVFTGNANPRLAQEVAKHLNLSLGRVIAGKFSDGEVMVELLENVRGKDVFVLQSISARWVANWLTPGGVPRLLTRVLHADQSQGFCALPVDNIYAAPVLLGDVWKQRYENLIVVSPDVGGVVRARALAKRMESDLAIIDKRRPKANVSEVMNVIGELKARTSVIMADIVATP